MKVSLTSNTVVEESRKTPNITLIKGCTLMKYWFCNQTWAGSPSLWKIRGWDSDNSAFLFCRELLTTTTGNDIFDAVSCYFQDNSYTPTTVYQSALTVQRHDWAVKLYRPKGSAWQCLWKNKTAATYECVKQGLNVPLLPLLFLFLSHAKWMKLNERVYGL